MVWDLVLYGGIGFGCSEAEICCFFQQCWVFRLVGFSGVCCKKLGFWDWLFGLSKVLIFWSCESWGSVPEVEVGCFKCWGFFIEGCGMRCLIRGWIFWGVGLRLIRCEWGWSWLCFVVKPVSVENQKLGSLWFALHECEASCFCKVVHQVFFLPFLVFEWGFVRWRYEIV